MCVIVGMHVGTCALYKYMALCLITKSHWTTPCTADPNQKLDERVVRRYQSLVERVTQPGFWYIHKGYLVRAHSLVRDSLYLPNAEILQYAQHMVPDAIQLSDLAPARYTVMLQWEKGTVTGKTRLVRDQWISRCSNTIDCFDSGSVLRSFVWLILRSRFGGGVCPADFGQC